MNITEVIAEAGDYYMDGGQGAKDILQRFRQKNESDSLCTDVAPTNDTVVRKASANTTSVLQAFQKVWTPKGATTFKMEPIQLFKIKADVEESPDDLEDSWLGSLAGIDENDRAKWPFVRWWLESEIMPVMEEDYEVGLHHKGVATTPTSGTAGAVAGAMDGFNVIINRHVASGRTAPIIVGAPPEDPVLFVKYMQDLANGVPRILQNKLEPWRLNQTLGKRYLDGVDELYNKQYANVTDKALIHNTNMRIAVVSDPDTGLPSAGLRSMEGSTKIWTTVKKNSVIRTKNPANQKVFKIESAKRQVSAYTDFWKGLGLWLPEYVFTNNQDLTQV